MRNTDGAASPNPPRSMRWPLIVVGILSCHVLLLATVAAIATRDPSFAVLPDYYKRALEWDKNRAAVAQSQALGWKLHIEASSAASPLGEREVTFLLEDAASKPVDVAQLNVTYFHHAHASDIRTVTLDSVSPGRFVARLRMRYAGIYQFETKANRGSDAYVDTVTQQIGAESSR